MPSEEPKIKATLTAVTKPDSTWQVTVTSCGWLTAVTAAIWLLLAWPAWALAETPGLEGLTYAALLCLVPGWLVFAISSKFRETHAQAAMVFLAGSMLRLLFVLGGTLVLQSARPALGFREFVVWVLVFYMTTLLTETLIVLKQKPAEGARADKNGR